MIASMDVGMCGTIEQPKRGKKNVKRQPTLNVDVVDMLKKLRADEHTAEKISEITGLPVKLIKEHW